MRDCAREEGAGRAGPTHLIPRRGNFGLSEDGDQDGDDQMVGDTERKVWQDPDTLFVINTDKLEHDNFMHTLANERNFLDSLAEIQDLNYMCLFLTSSL